MSTRPVQPGTPGASIVEEEERLLALVQARVAQQAAAAEEGNEGSPADYDEDLISLRDQIAEAKPEDLGPLVEQMARVSAIAARRGKGASLPADPRSPYFAHMRLAEDGRRRDVLIGKRAFIDRQSGVQIVDWRNAPVSRIYYRYEEGDDYDENFPGGRLNGMLELRRNLSIAEGSLRRIGTPQGVYVRDTRGGWHESADLGVPVLQGGQGVAARPPRPAPARRGPGSKPQKRAAALGHDQDLPARSDKHLPEIAALIDKEQFALITEPDSGLIVIQGGAGSGKTTVALHRVAFLHYQDPKRFHPHSVLVVVPSMALARYVEGVLPSLEVRGVPVTTYARWMAQTRKKVLPGLPEDYASSTPSSVSRIKKHPALLPLMDRYVARQLQAIEVTLPEEALAVWRTAATSAPVRRVGRVLAWLDKQERFDAPTRQRIEGALRRARKRLGDVVQDWQEMLTDLPLLREGFAAYPDVSEADLAETVKWTARKGEMSMADELEGVDADRLTAVDGSSLADEAAEGSLLDPEDDPILLRFAQMKQGSLIVRPTRPDAPKKEIRYEHVVIDEAQDMAAIDVKVLLEATTPARSVTIAGDVSQRLVFDNAFDGWEPMLRAVGHEAVEIRPLRLSYRSTAEVMMFARAILGPLADPDAPLVARNGAPVAMHRFYEMGEAVAFLADALRSLLGREPTASVALIARHAGQADGYFEGLQRAEVPALRRVRRQDFAFTPGVDVTDVTQVKGLEFDYVVLLEVTRASYPDSVEARHLLHIGATRAAHQLWLVATDQPSPLLPADLSGDPV